MRKSITHNLGLKIFSVLFAVVLWLIVVNTIDPVTTATFTNIKVEMKNETAITNQGKVYDILDDSDTISVTIKANRSVIENIKSADIAAVADMNEMVVADTVPIDVTCNKYASYIEEIVPKTKTVKISIEESATKQFAIGVTTVGTPSSGYAVGEATCTPNVLKVSGPASVVNKISKIMVEADVTDMSTLYSNTLTPKFYDTDGDIIESSRLTYRTTDVTVNVTMLKTKTIPLSFKVTGTPAENYAYVETVCTPETVTIAGSPANLAKVTDIEIPNSQVDISGATNNVQKMVSISEYIPEDVKLVNADEGSVLVTAIIEKLKTKTFEIKTDNIKLLNVPSGYTASISTGDNIIITVKGLEENIDKISADDIKASVDLSKIITAGLKTLPVDIELPADVKAEAVDMTVGVMVQKSQATLNP